MIQRFSIVLVLAALAALLPTISPLSAQGASTKRCAQAGKQYQSWTVFGANRKVGDPKTKLVAKRGVRNLVTVEAPGTPAATGKYHVTITPKKGCEVAKVRVKTRRGFYKLVRISTAGGTISFRATKGDPFPYREVRVWNRKARSGSGSSSRPGSKRDGDNCEHPFRATITGTDRSGDLREIRLYEGLLTDPPGARFGWELLNGNVLCKYRLYLSNNKLVEPTSLTLTTGWYDYHFGDQDSFSRLTVWARRP